MSFKQYDDRNTFSGRIKRYGSLSRGIGEATTKILWQRLFAKDASNSFNAKIITEMLGGLKGPTIKIAQMLATIPDAIPEEYAEQFLTLQANAPSMGWPFVRRRMQSELGPDWQCKFLSFEPQAFAAASLGQVHCAMSLANQPLACKLQYPEMEATMEADLNQLKVLLSLYQLNSKAIHTEEIFQEIKERLQEELNYEHEASNINIYRYIFGISQNGIEIQKK